MKRTSVFLCLFLIGSLAFVSCGKRLPSPQTAHKIITKSFAKYGKKYPQSDFGKNKVQKVEITDIQEIQKNFVSVISYIHLSNDTNYRVRVTLWKKPFGWKYVSWENLGGQ